MRDFHDLGLVLWLIRGAGRALTGLGALALLLAAIGVYGVKTYVVSQRTREIGIRLALGAAPRDIAWMLVRDGARMTLVGVALGFPLAVLTAAAALATYLPARRGMRVSPLEALRTE